MRILIVHSRYARLGGEDAVVDTEAAALVAHGHEVAMLEPKNAGLTPLRAGLELAVLARNPVAAARFRRLAKQFRPDVVHVHNLFPRLGASVLLEARRLDLPLVMTLHNYRWLCPVGTFVRSGEVCRLCASGDYGHSIRHACFRDSRILTSAYALALTVARRSRWPHGLAHRLVCVSEAQRREYVAAGWPEAKLLVKGNFLAHEPDPTSGSGEGALYLGRMSREKGPQVLLEAWAAMDSGRATLSLAGEGPLGAELRKRTMPGARWLGFLDAPAAANALVQHAFLVVPSIWPETFGLGALQAMACGRPVVASAVGGLPELVRDGETGLLVEPNNPRDLAKKLSWMLAHPEERQAMGRRARAFALERFGPQPGLRALESLYEQTIRAARD